jgi:hypothetical protein
MRSNAGRWPPSTADDLHPPGPRHRGRRLLRDQPCLGRRRHLRARGRHLLQAPPRAADAVGARRSGLHLVARGARPARVGRRPGRRREGLFDGLRDYFGARTIAGRVELADVPAGVAPQPVPGDGPMFWAPAVPDGPIEVRVTNTGAEAWPAGSRIEAGWETSDAPYLPRPPADLQPTGPEIRPSARGVGPHPDRVAPAARRGSCVGMDLAIGRSCILADRGSPPRFSSPAKRPEVMRTAPNRMNRRYHRAGVRNAVAAPLARCYHAPSMRSAIGHRHGTRAHRVGPTGDLCGSVDPSTRVGGVQFPIA